MKKEIQLKTFYSVCQDSYGKKYLFKKEIIESWEHESRRLVLHEGENEKWDVSDYLTGMRCTSHKFKTQVKKDAETIITRIIKEKRIDKYPHVNNPSFIAGYTAANDLMNGNSGHFQEGVMFAIQNEVKV